jgi:hypothetical protein
VNTRSEELIIIMDSIERTLLEGALKRSKLILLHGFVSSERDVLEHLRAHLGQIGTLDCRSADMDPRERIRGLIETQRALFISMAPSPGDKMLATIEALANHPREGDTAIALSDDARILVWVGGESASESAARAFPLRLSGMRIIEEMRAREVRAEAELKQAQERAKESSRRHGIR